MDFLSYLVGEVIATLKYYRGFLMMTYIIGAIVVLYCLFV
jgi:hypothetical protein